MIKVGTIGLGKMGLSHYAIIKAHPDVDAVAVCDASGFVLSGLEKQTGVKTFKDYKRMIDDCDLDGVIIATPTKTHAEMAQYALEMGVNVFCEKPFTLTLEDGNKLVKLAEEYGLVNQVGFHNRYIGTFLEARRLVKSGAIGKVYHAMAEAYGPVVIKPQEGAGATWRSEKGQGGGCLHDYASHIIDLSHFVLNDYPERVGGTELKSIFSTGVEDSVYSTAFFKDGKTTQISVNWSDETYRKMTNRLTILGTGGKIVVDRQEIRAYIKDDKGFEKLPQGWSIRYITELQKPVWFYLRGEEYSSQMDYFVQQIKEKSVDNINSFANALQTDTVIDKLAADGNH